VSILLSKIPYENKKRPRAERRDSEEGRDSVDSLRVRCPAHPGPILMIGNNLLTILPKSLPKIKKIRGFIKTRISATKINSIKTFGSHFNEL
jgi:hypothetical protein